MSLCCLAVAATVVLASAPPGAVDDAPVQAPFWPSLRPGFRIGDVDNLRFGLTTFQDAATAALFAGRNGVSLGFDYNLGSGFAMGLDSVNLYKDYDGTSYFLSVNPLELKYRFGLPLGDGAHLLPYGTLGAGLAFMGLVGGPSALPRAGVGYAGSAALGVMLRDALTFEVGYGGGRVGNVTDYGLQLRIGTPFDNLGDLPFWPWHATPRVASAAPSTSPAGVVEGVVGDRLALQIPPNLHLKEGSDVLIYYDEGIPNKVARARIETLSPDGRATAQVVAATGPIKPGYRVRAW